jgi:hypothetical protein
VTKALTFFVSQLGYSQLGYSQLRKFFSNGVFVMMLLVLLALTQTPTTTTLHVHGQGPGFQAIYFGDTIKIEADVRSTANNGFRFRRPGPTGTVDILIDGIPNIVTLNAFGQAIITTSTLPVGPHTLDAVYNGDNNFGPSTATTVTFTISPAKTHTDLVTSARFALPTTTLTFTAHVSTGWGWSWRGHSVPVTQGSVDFIIDGVVAMTVPVDGSGNAAYSTTLPLGTHTIVARYDGTTNFNTSTSCTERVNIVATLPSHSFYWFHR